MSPDLKNLGLKSPDPGRTALPGADPCSEVGSPIWFLFYSHLGQTRFM